MFKKLIPFAAAAMTALVLLPQPVSAQGKKDSVAMAMALEPPGLDPTSGAAAAIAAGPSPASPKTSPAISEHSRRSACTS